MFWYVLNTIWPFLENVCLSQKFCGHCIARTNGQKLMKLYIQLHLYVIWSWLDFGVYRSRNSNVMRIILSQSFWNSKYLFIIAIVRSYIIFAYMGQYSPVQKEGTPPGWEEFFTISTFRKNMRCITENYIIKTLNEKFLFPSSDLRHALKIPLVFFFLSGRNMVIIFKTDFSFLSNRLLF